MASPPPKKFGLVLEAGAVFYFKEEGWNTPKPHYFVVLNKNPNLVENIILVPATTLDIWSATSVEKFPEATIVALGPKDCSFLTVESLFNCNFPLSKLKKVLESKYVGGKLALSGKVTPEILDKLRNGVLSSKIVPVNIQKKLVE
jgi:hypothetical protein